MTDEIRKGTKLIIWIHEFNLFVISVLVGWFISLHYPIISFRIPLGLILSSLSFWYLSLLNGWNEAKK